ncbi:hypothetical protein EZV62_021420 [Acer yangbiense]|uniref:Glutathione peroxidase n=1 Tax=Acer yangbiense TaxID=1000413 RepID=A0A5C7H5K2_9ROSI|nr:hypothetical protein EZV62_021420 [Acer yangbiense]
MDPYKEARGNDVDLSIYKGKVFLIVKVASQCGLTNSNYTEFGAQEPRNNEQILEFACTLFKAEYPIFDVNQVLEIHLL